MAEQAKSTPIRFTSIHPVLAVSDLEGALAYYRDRLGFSVSWQWGDGSGPAVRAGVERDGLEIQLVADGRFAPETASVVYVHVRGVDAYYRACVERGAEITMPLADRPFGMRDFRVVDPSGNALGFGEPMAYGRLMTED